jgi:hypothetical protein
MASVELTTEQIISLARQLPAEDKRDLIMALAGDSQSSRTERMAIAERRLREVAFERGMNWDSMSDNEREALADDLVHEDRSCPE